MPNVRKKGTKLAGAYVSDEKDDALAKAAKERGFPDKASFIRYLYDKALEADPSDIKQTPKRGRT